MNPKEHSPKPDIKIELAKPEDAEEIYDVQSKTWLATYPSAEHGITEADIREYRGMDIPKLRAEKISNWRESIQKQSSTMQIQVAKVDGKIVGFSVARGEKERGNVGALYVDPDLHGLGVGAQLFQTSLDFLGDREVYVLVAGYNTPAIEFYSRFGFEPVGRSDEAITFPSGAVLTEIEMVRPVQ